MLTKLNISNFLLIDKIELDFNSGLTVITGETGSGKSIIIDALMLIFGARANSEIIRKGSNQAIFAAEFTIKDNSTVQEWLQENDLTNPDDATILLCRRVIDNNGKSKNYLNGTSVTSSQMKSIGEILIDIHTQHASIALLKPDNQRALLDEYAGLNSQTKQLSTYYKQITDLEHKMQQALSHSQDLNIKQEILNEKISRLAELNLGEDEWEQLNNEHSQLSNAQLIIQELDFAVNLINDKDESLLEQINHLQQRLSKIAEFSPRLTAQIEILDSVEAEMREIYHELQSATNNIDQDPQSLAKVEQRIEQIFSIARRERITPEQIIPSLSAWQEELININQEYDLEAIQKELDDTKNIYMQVATDVSNKRQSAAVELSNKVTQTLHMLAINGEFKINLTKLSQYASYGLEQIEYQIAFNKGMELKPLAKVASGGELSRTALALYVILSTHNPPEIIIFDEIDVGIGGKVAEIVGKLLAQLGLSKQIICITHQAQTASCGNNHMVVSKIDTDDRTISQLDYVNNNARINEIARILGGINITDTTLKHAREMLEHART